jgi:hypothetical protein
MEMKEEGGRREEGGGKGEGGRSLTAPLGVVLEAVEIGLLGGCVALLYSWGGATSEGDAGSWSARKEHSSSKAVSSFWRVGATIVGT